MRQHRNDGRVRQLAGERMLHNDHAIFRSAYDRSLRPDDLLFVEHMARLTPNGWGETYWAMRLGYVSAPELRAAVGLMDEAAREALGRGLTITELQKREIGMVALTNYGHAALWITRYGVTTADLAQGARLGDAFVEISMDKNEAVIVCDVSPDGTTVHADWSRAYDWAADSLPATGS